MQEMIDVLISAVLTSFFAVLAVGAVYINLFDGKDAEKKRMDKKKRKSYNKRQRKL